MILAFVDVSLSDSQPNAFDSDQIVDIICADWVLFFLASTRLPEHLVSRKLSEKEKGPVSGPARAVRKQGP